MSQANKYKINRRIITISIDNVYENDGTLKDDSVTIKEYIEDGTRFYKGRWYRPVDVEYKLAKLLVEEFDKEDESE